MSRLAGAGLALVVLGAAATALGQSSVPGPVGFARFMEAVLASHPTGEQQRRTVGAADANVQRAWANLGPTISGSAQYGRRNEVQFVQETPDPAPDQTITVIPESIRRLDINASQPLFDGRMSGGIQLARQNRTQARAEASWRIQGLFVAAGERYLDAWAAEERLEAARRDLGRAERGLALVREQVALGGAERSAALQAEIDRMQAALAVTSRAEERDRFYASLAEWMGMGGARAPAGMPAAVPATPPTQPDAKRLGRILERRLDLRALREQSDIARGQRNVSMGGFLPRLTVDAGFTRDLEAGAFADRDSWQVAGRADWTFLQGGSRVFETVARAREAAGALAAYRSARLAARDDVRESVARLRRAAAARRVARRSLVLAERQYRGVTERFRGGGASLLELNDARARLASAHADTVEQRAALVAAWMHYWRMSGELVAEAQRRWGVEIPQFMEVEHGDE